MDSGIPLAVGGTTLLHPDLNDASRYLLSPILQVKPMAALETIMDMELMC